MAEQPTEVPSKAKRASGLSRRMLLIAPALLLTGASGGYFGVTQGISAIIPKGHDKPSPGRTAQKDIAFIALEPIVINLGTSGSGRFVRFQAQIEVNAKYQAEVAMLLPRLVDVLNGYLRAVDLAVLEDRTALVRLKAQMLRRVQLVAGTGRVRDLLVMDFLVS